MLMFCLVISLTTVIFKLTYLPFSVSTMYSPVPTFSGVIEMEPSTEPAVTLQIGLVISLAVTNNLPIILP